MKYTTNTKKRISHLGPAFLRVAVAILFVLLFQVQNANAAIISQLDFGSTGSDVVELQTYLAMNTEIYPSGVINGHFDSPTESAVKMFQKSQGIVYRGTPTTTGYGRVGPSTLMRLNALMDLIIINQLSSDMSPTTVSSSGLPMSLTIPKIDVEARIEYMGIAPDGKMDMSESLKNVNWFDEGTRPGDDGSAVIGGHTIDYLQGVTSVFNNLSKLSQGDTLTIVDHEGDVMTFVVREIKIYDSEADATDVFTSSDRESHLNLITCYGVWNEVTKSYPDRLVVFTDKEVSSTLAFK